MKGKDLAKLLLAGALGALCLAAASGVGTPALATPVAGPGAPGGSFHPLSVTFVSLRTGWSLGTVPCRASGACLVLEKTTNAGRTWAGEPLPQALVASADRSVSNGVPKGSPGRTALPAVLYGPYGLNVRFADALDGWVYGGLASSSLSQAAVLWSTHDGGGTWHHVALLPGHIQTGEEVIFDLEAAGGTSYAMVPKSGGGVSVESSPVRSDNWHVDSTPALNSPAGGGEQEGSFVFQGGKGWLVEGNDRGVTGSARLLRAGGDKWAAWAPPCAKVGDSFFVPAASTSADLVDVCQMGGFASPLSKSAPRGATLGSYWLYSSSNGGQSFSSGQRLGGGNYRFDGLIASPRPGSVFVGSGPAGGSGPGGGSGQELLASFDGGRSWASVYKGDFFYLGFTSPDQGVGLLGPSTGNGPGTEMVMTFDGGAHWSRTSF
jgi:hypothetical protein